MDDLDFEKIETKLDEVHKQMELAGRDFDYSVKMYDFKGPDKFSKDQMRAVQIIFEKFARLITSSLTFSLRTFVNVNVANVAQANFEEFGRSISYSSPLSIIEMEPLSGSIILSINRTLSVNIIDRLLGGEGKAVDEFRETTQIDKTVLEHMITPLMGSLSDAWVKVVDLHPKLKNIETEVLFAQIVPPHEKCILLTLEMRMGDVEGILSFCIPFNTVEAVLPKLSLQNFCQASYTDFSPSKIGITLSVTSQERKLSACERLNEEIASDSQRIPFDALNHYEPGHLATLLLFEHPQTIALVLSYLSSKNAAEILSEIPIDIQGQIANRIARIEKPTSQILLAVEKILVNKLASLSENDLKKIGGIEALAKILHGTDRAPKKYILEYLECEDPELAGVVKKYLSIIRQSLSSTGTIITP